MCGVCVLSFYFVKYHKDQLHNEDWAGKSWVSLQQIKWDNDKSSGDVAEEKERKKTDTVFLYVCIQRIENLIL